MSWPRNLADTPKYEDLNAKILKSGEFSDFVITCRDQSFKVHRALLVNRSPYLDVLVKGPFKETTEQSLNLPDCDPAVLAIALYYMYTGYYPKARKVSSDTEHGDHIADALAFAPFAEKLLRTEWQYHVQMAQLGDRLMIPDLFRVAADSLVLRIRSGILMRADGEARGFEQAMQKLFGVVCDDDSDGTNSGNDNGVETDCLEHSTGKTSMDHLADRVAWQLASTFYHIDVARTPLSRLGRTLPSFAWKWLEGQQRISNQDTWSCALCRKKQDQKMTQNLLVRDESSPDYKKFGWMACECDFSGLCSSTCWPERRLIGCETYCSQCRWGCKTDKFLKCNFAQNGTRLRPFLGGKAIRCRRYVDDKVWTVDESSF